MTYWDGIVICRVLLDVLGGAFIGGILYFAASIKSDWAGVWNDLF